MKKTALSGVLALALLAGTLPVSAGAAFTDIKDPDTVRAAAVLNSMGVVSGTTKTTYSPNTKLTRAEFCTLAVRAMGMADQAETSAYKTLFSDVKPGSWYAGYVNLAYSEGIISGYGNGRFGPEDSVTYGQVATILLRLLGYNAADVGKVWPTDYVNYAKDLELTEGLSIGANAPVTRGQAAVLLYNTFGTEIKDQEKEYFETIKGVASSEEVVLLDNAATSGATSNLLMVCKVGKTEAAVEHYTQKNKLPDELVGYLGTLLFNSAGKTIGFMPSNDDFADVVVASAKSSAITAQSGETHRISGGAQVILNGSIYPYSSSGYLQVDRQKGKNARIFYNDAGVVNYIYLSSGTASASTDAAVAETKTAGSELVRRLGISGNNYAVSKNGASAALADVAQHDVAYYDAATKTMCVSDYKVGGYVQAASPSVAAAKTITVSGSTMPVLESAWDTLSKLSLGDRVTLLLTDDGKVAAAYADAKLSTEMLGVLSADGNAVTLVGSGLTLTADEISAPQKLRGTLVRVRASDKTTLTCTAYSASGAPGKVDIAAGTVGSYDMAPGIAVYEWAGSGYVSSLTGERGKSSSDLSEITWTKSLASSYVSSYRLNAANQVDMLLLKDVTGNFYEYGKLGVKTEVDGGGSMAVRNTFATITNSKTPGGSGRYVYAQQGYGGSYVGVSLAATETDGLQRVNAVAKLTASTDVSAKSFFQNGDDWYVTVGEHEIAVSDDVQVYVKSLEKWYSGEEGVLTALSSDLKMSVHYDRTFTSGAQVRVIALEG